MFLRLLGLNTEAGIRRALHLSGVMALGLAFYIGYLVHMTRIHSMPLPFHRDIESLFDVVLFTALAGGILLHLRMAAFLVLLCFVLDQWQLFRQGSLLYQSLMILTGMIFLRGALAAVMPGSERQSGDSSENLISAPKRFPGLFFFLAGALLIFLLGGGYFMLNENKPVPSDLETAVSLPLSTEKDANLTFFELITGETVRGKILHEDEVFFQVDVNGSERILIKEDIKSFGPAGRK